MQATVQFDGQIFKPFCIKKVFETVAYLDKNIGVFFLTRDDGKFFKPHSWSESKTKMAIVRELLYNGDAAQCASFPNHSQDLNCFSSACKHFFYYKPKKTVTVFLGFKELNSM